MSGFRAFKAQVPIQWSESLYITLVRGLPGTRKLHRRTLEAMGLRRCHRTVLHSNTSSIRGMIQQVLLMLMLMLFFCWSHFVTCHVLLSSVILTSNEFLLVSRLIGWLLLRRRRCSKLAKKLKPTTKLSALRLLSVIQSLQQAHPTCL